MNAAARLVHQGVLTRRHFVMAHLMSRQQIVIFGLALSVLFSALSIIYVTHLTRVMHAAYQHNVQEQARLHVERGQLLLERSTWMMQARTQQLAEAKLNMVIPDNKSVTIIAE